MDMSVQGRVKFIIILIAVIGIVMAGRLVQLQVVQGEEYQAMSENGLVRSMPLKAARGELFDRYGRPLVTNRQSFTIVFLHEHVATGVSKNDLILKAIKVVEGMDGTYTDTLPITKEQPFEFTFTGSNADAREAAFKGSFKIKEDANATEAVASLVGRYGVAGKITVGEARQIVGVRYEMEQRQFSVQIPYTFATDVDINVVSVFKEKQEEFPGVEIVVEPIREYVNGSLLAHLLGRVGPIYAEEYEELKDKGYSMNDIVGKDGLEKYLETDIRGVDGISAIEQNIEGNISRTYESKAAVAGNYAVLTIDLNIQTVLEDSLKETIHDIQSHPNTSDAASGAAVVLDVNSGEVLAMASYPTFDPATFNEDFDQLNADPLRPMFNRAISGTYAPGSTFKALTAIAALQEGVVTPNTAIEDKGKYKYYEDYQPACLIWSMTGATHGMVDVREALQESCNYYFYDVGRRLGIDNLKKYGDLFGFGQKTGIEISGESSGIFASPEYRNKIGETWYDGDTLQAAIGQSDHLFTPIQIANYIATIANGGTRYKPFLVKSIQSYTDSGAGRDTQSTVLNDIALSAANYQAVMGGLKAVSQSGTASSVFANYRVEVGSKTGTATVSSGSANGIFIAFAPFNSPEIAIVIVVEHGGSGSAVATVAKDVFDAYFDLQQVEDQIVKANTLLQ